MSLLRHLPRFRKAYADLDKLAARETWSRAQIEDYQRKRLHRVWQHALQTVPYYQQLHREHSLPTQFDSLDEFFSTVPLLDKELVRENPERFLSSSCQSGSWHRTGGSTGVPMGIFWEHKAHREMLRCKYRAEQQWGLDIFDRKAFLWGHGASFAATLRGRFDRWSQPLFDQLRNRLRLSAYQLGPDDLTHHVRQIEKFQPTSIYGYSSAILLLARHAAEIGMQCPSLKVAIMTAEPADEALVEEVEHCLGIPAMVEYGAVECGLMATRGPDRALRVREDHILLETCERSDKRHDIIVTVLNNPSFPLIRYRIEDVTDSPLQFDDSGFAQLANVMGRSNDVLISRKGRSVHSMAVKHALEYHPRIHRFQAYQDKSGKLTVTIEADQETSPEIFESSRLRIIEMLDGFPVEICVVEIIPGNQAGKHRWILSDFENENA